MNLCVTPSWIPAPNEPRQPDGDSSVRALSRAGERKGKKQKEEKQKMEEEECVVASLPCSTFMSPSITFKSCPGIYLGTVLTAGFQLGLTQLPPFITNVSLRGTQQGPYERRE